VTKLSIIQHRVGGRSEPWRQTLERKWESLRKYANGDLSELGMMNPQTAYETGDDRVPANSSGSDVSHEQIEVEDLVSGALNRIQIELKEIASQITIKAPDFDFDNCASPEHEDFHRVYMEKVWGPEPYGCDAVPVIEQSIYDMLICGIGFPGLTVQDGRPRVTRYMPDKVLWDRSGAIQEARWCAIWEKRRASQWADVFTSDIAREKLEPYMDKDDTVELVFYYDVEGEKGTSAVFFAQDENVDPDPIDGPTDSIWYVQLDINGNTSVYKKFLPVYPMVYSNPSGTMTPVGLVQILLPAQLFLFQAERQKLRHLNMRPATVINMNMLEQRTKEELAKGNWPDFFLVNGEASAAVGVVNPPPMDGAILMHEERAERFIREASDSSPYAQGQPQGVAFAAEANLMAQQGAQGLTTLVSRVARVIEVLAQRFLWAASEMDDAPIRLQIGETALDFDENEPVAAFLEPHATVRVLDDTVRYVSREQQVARAKSLASDLAAFGFPDVALNTLLQAYGDKTISSEISKAKSQMKQAQMGGGAQ